MTATTHRAPRTGRTRRLAACAAGLLALTLVSFGAQPAQAATKTNPGWHQVCAQTLTMSDDYGFDHTLIRGDYVNVAHYYFNYAYADGTAWRYVAGKGWVNLGFGIMSNGWFC